MPTKLILTINTAEKRIQFLFSNEEGLIYAEDFAAKKGATEFLIPAIHQACLKNGLNYQDISHIACVAGPGNFMGIRLSVVTVAALSRTLQCFQAPLDYLQCIAANIPAKENDTVRVITNATRSSVHCCDYIFDQDGIPNPISTLSLIPVPTLTDFQEAQSSIIPSTSMYPKYIMGSGLTTHKEYFKNAYPDSVHFISEGFDDPSIHALHSMTKQAKWQKEDITPIYLKECDALQNLNSIATQQGRNPEKAHIELKRLMQL